jgi:undecaprenyl-diphosphatase
MSIIQSIILGIIQGLAEFLPISSSAHLILIPWLLKWQEHTLAFDVALHFGTFLAVAIYFFKDYVNLVVKGLSRPSSQDGKIFWGIVIAMIPAAIFGVLLEKIVESVFREQILVIALVLAFFGIILFLIDKLVKKEKTLRNFNLLNALLIGLSQVLALFPGVSRSGITIAAGMSLGYKRDEAARFSFLLSGPVIFGAALLSFVKNIGMIKSELLFFMIGIASSFAVGMAAIHFLLKYLKSRTFLPFVIYRLVFAALIITVLIIRL